MSQVEGTFQKSFRSAVPSLHYSPSPEADYETAYSKFHQHSVSDSTNTTGSNDSSPTTTISTVDDSSATEPSPGSSPESPPPTTFAVGMLRPRATDERRGTFFELQKEPPPRKGRNLKNLAVNTTRQPGKPNLSLPVGTPADSNATLLSPSFVKPPTPPRRKPTNLGLTILTPGSAKAFPQEIRLSIPPTPGFNRPALRHFQSSPSLPLAPGLNLPPSSPITNARRPRPLPLETVFSPVKESFQIDEEDEQNFDVPLSKEEKPEAYPDGPICVYDPSIDLYLEPTAEQARTYDVILNVASEVRNPFVTALQTPAIEPELRIDGGGGIQYAPKRDHLNNQSAEDESSKRDASPTTPKATPLNATFPQSIEPEYIHIPWEHNSDIVPDLLRLVKLMDEKVKYGKRVLVHCQCGVSRSASLVVAYGLYKAPSMSVQEAYDTVKKRSKWIGPNMNLIMQLQEFRTSLANGGRLASNRGSGMSPITPSSAMSDWRSPFSMRPSSFLPRDGPLSAGAAPTLKIKASDDLVSVSPGPSSAPSGISWPTNDSSASSRACTANAVKNATAFVDPSGHVLPVLKVIEADTGSAKAEAPRDLVVPAPLVKTFTLPDIPASPRSTEFAMAPLQPTREVDSADSFGLMSPTATEFSSPPFDRSALLASLGMGSMRQDEETPRRSLSLRPQQSPTQQSFTTLNPAPARRLRSKISAPTLREQEQLQSLQAKIQASLPARSLIPKLSTVDEALMSPRATEFTSNPFALSLSAPSGPPTADASVRPRTSHGTDPRSPAHKGAVPITRNIFDVL